MRISLLDEEDLAAIERTLMRAMVRAIRLLAKEGVFGAVPKEAANAPAGTVPAGQVPPEIPEVEPPIASPPSPTNGAGSPTPADPPVTILPAVTRGPRPWAKAPEPPPEKRTRRSVTEVCKTVGDRPEGYIDTTRAYELIGGTGASATLSMWIMGHQVEAVIVANYPGTPTKGLPGRLMVSSSSLRARIQLRDENRKLPPAYRTSKERMAVSR